MLQLFYINDLITLDLVLQLPYIHHIITMDLMLQFRPDVVIDRPGVADAVLQTAS